MHYKRINTSPLPTDKKMVLKVELLPNVFSKICEVLKPNFEQDISIEELKDSVNHFLTFDISSYANLCNGAASYWDEHIGFTDKVFRLFSEDEEAVFAIMLIQNHQLIKTTMAELEYSQDQTSSLSQLCKTVSESILMLDKVIGLFAKIQAVGATIPIPINPELGTREQDSEDLTFFPEHIRAVFSIIITVKVFLPLFATMLAESKNTSVAQKRMKESFGKVVKVKTKLIDNKTKELFCLAFIEKLFYEHIQLYYDKLLGYFSYFTERSQKKSSTMAVSAIFSNITQADLTKMVEANIICKRCVNIGLYTQSEKVMGILRSAVRTTVESIEKDNKNSTVFTRQLQGGNEDATTNESHMEANSLRSKEPDSQALIIRRIYEKAVIKYTQLFGIDPSLLKKVTQYNIRQNTPIEDFVPILLSSMFYKDFESSQSIKILDYEPFMTLLSLAQIICAKKGMFGLAHRITAQRCRLEDGSYELKTRNIADTILTQNALADARPVLDNMQKCKTRITTQDKTRTLVKEVRRWIGELANFFTSYQCYYRTCPDLAVLMGHDPENFGPFELQSDLLRSFCIILERKLI